MMGVLTSTNRDSQSCSNDINENKIVETSLKDLLITNNEGANKDKLICDLPFEHILASVKLFKN